MTRPELDDAVREAWGLTPQDRVRIFFHTGAWAQGVRVRRGWRTAGVIVPNAVVLCGQTADYLKHHIPGWLK